MATAKKATKKASSKKATSKKTATKKTTKRAATKKATAKKSSTAKKATKQTSAKKSDSEARVLVCATGKECFWTTDGQILRDLTELRDALSDMAPEVFTHHVSEERNDFADWVEGVLEDAACAAALRRSKKPASAHTVVVKHLKFYSI